VRIKFFVVRKVLECTIKTIDDKNHIRIWNASQVEIKFKDDVKKEIPKELPKKQESKITKPIKKLLKK